MSGKAYTMREMKSIVDYLTLHHLFGETRGRKMWMDFANSEFTIRTWQSLKETFLKRILPDITNPYYRLDPDQILSFKRGVNLTQKDKKLELRPVDSSINKGANDAVDQPSTRKKNTEENATGEDTQCSNVVHDRASTETLVLDTCYQTGEDMQSDLESANEETDVKTNNKSKPALKSVRDLIEFTEPLTPMLQEVLHDFATDEDCSDTDPPMQIDENYVAPGELSDTPENPPSSQSILKPKKTQNTVKLTAAEEKDNLKQLRNAKLGNEKTEEPVRDETAFSQLENVMVLVDEALAKDIDTELRNIESQEKEVSSNQSIPMTDSLLPNNQEAIKTASPFKVQSPILHSPHRNSDQGIGKGESQVDKKLSNAKTNLVSDKEPEQKASEEVIKIDSKDTTQEKPAVQNKESLEKSSINDDKVHEILSDSSTGNKDVDPPVDNPCLKSVSLFEQQLITTQYSDSDTKNKENVNGQPEREAQNTAESTNNKDLNNDETKVNKDKNIKANKANTKEKATAGVILLNSRTTSESDDDSEIHHRPLARSSLKIRKDKKLANVFGFSNGGAPKSRRLNSRKRTTSHRNVQSDYSEWTSTSDSEYVSPPHGRRNRYARRYQKPRAARVMSLEEEGGLFVMMGKKVYPLVKDGKALKNYVTFLPDSDPEEDESYWKSKYIEERKRTDELKKKLGHPKSNSVLDKEEKERSISVSSVTSPLIENRQRLGQESVQGHELIRRYSGFMEKQPSKETLKIKFTKNDQEVQLEGHWQHINPVLAQVVSILHKDSEKKADTVTCVELSSGNTTPITPTVAPMDTGVRDKVDALESEIFKEIEEKDKKDKDRHEDVEQKEGQEQNAPAEKINTVQENVEEPQNEQPNITQRKKRGRPKKEVSPALAAAQSPAKKSKQSVEPNKFVEELKALEVDNSTPNVGRLTRSPRKILNDITPKPKTTRKSSTKLQPEAPVASKVTPVAEEIEEDEVRYKFPSPGPETLTRATNTSKVSPKKHLPNTASPESLSHHSTTSSQGYQDSDPSPLHVNVRRKRRLSISALSIKGRKIKRKQRSRSYPLVKHINSDSDSSYTITFKTTTKEQSTINSEVYGSDSYQFLMPGSRTVERLEKIDEANDHETDTLANEIRELRDEILKANDSVNKSDHASSSIVSLPLSPELSIVENISVSKSAIAEISGHPTINEIEKNNAQGTCNNKYFMSQVDVSMPLMEQDCELKDKYKKHLMAALTDLSDAANSAGRNLSRNSSMRMSITSESILRSYPVINVESSDSLDKRLERLLLESAQKPANMEEETIVKKKGSRKRCSTPHKKKTVQSKKKGKEEPVIVEEESKARCSRGGRRSCPPSVNIFYCEKKAPDNLEINIHDESIDVTTVTKRKRVKKDIIKVKIVKPKVKPQKKKSPKKKLQNVSRSSVTKGDNESGVFLHGFEDSSELIHNHSETCLQIGDCMGQDDSDSVEFIETTTTSIISLNSNSMAPDNKENLSRNTMESGTTSAELYCDNDNAQCATHLQDARAEVLTVDSGNTMYFTPFASRCNSALTEDLSDDPLPKPNSRPSKWYLLDEDETNTSYFDVHEKESPVYGSNLQQIFPITCAIPDLSSITEMSEKSENSQKATLDAEEIRRATK